MLPEVEAAVRVRAESPSLPTITAWRAVSQSMEAQMQAYERAVHIG